MTDLTDALKRFATDETLLVDWSEAAIDDLQLLMDAARWVEGAQEIEWCHVHKAFGYKRLLC